MLVLQAPAMPRCVVGIFDFFTRGSGGGIRSLSDSELAERHESVRKQYVSSRTIPEASRFEAMLDVINNEMVRRANEAYERENPNPPERRHREHGWYLPNDD